MLTLDSAERQYYKQGKLWGVDHAILALSAYLDGELCVRRLEGLSAQNVRKFCSTW